MSGRSRLRWSILALVLTAVCGVRASVPQDQPQQDQEQNQQDQQQKKKKKKGGFFRGLKAVTGESGEQAEETRTAGQKSVGEGEKIGNATPTAADREKLNGMERYSLSAEDLKKFQQEGHLSPKQ